MNPTSKRFKHQINNAIAILIIEGNLKKRVFEGTLKEVNEDNIVIDLNPSNAENKMPNFRTFGYETFILATELDIKLYHLTKHIL
ncbi:MAG: hypothetical protein V4648_04095 [Bacteroidota bacterium]